MLNKNKTYTPKEALDADPDWPTPVKLGRGRMPKGGDEHVRKLVEQGYRIKGYDAVSTAAASTSTPAPAKVVKVKADNVKVVQDFVILYDERMYKAVDVDGKTRSMREVCNNCRVSLVQCHCGDPCILGGIRVTIRPV